MKYSSIMMMLFMLLGETSIQDTMNATILIVSSVIPVLVLMLVLRMLFTTFSEISKTEYMKRIVSLLPLLAIGETAWETNMDIWSTITGIVLLVLPFLVLIIVLRSIFRYFTREW